MIDILEGKVLAASLQRVTVLVGGIGWGIQVPDGDVFAVGETIRFFTHMHWNADQGPSLFGFIREIDRRVFLLIIDCPGVGPKLALAILRQLSPGTFISALVQGDVKTLSSVSGVGTRKAETLIVSLKNKALDLMEKGLECGVDGIGAKNLTLVRQALEALNYDAQEISRAVEHVKGQGSFDQETVPVLLKSALTFLARSR